MDFGVRMSNLHNLFKSLWNRQVFLYLVSFALIWAVLLTLNLFLSRDIDDYGVNFNLAKAQNLSERLLAINWLKDPAYFLAQAFSAGMMPISIFFGIIIASCLALKWLALRQLVDRPGWIIILPYLCVLSFLHEGTQIRIAIALSIALWSLVLWSKEKYLNAFLLILLAASFHISGITFLLPYTIIWLADRFGKVIYVVSASIGMLLAFPGVSDFLLVQWGELVHARYMTYARGAIYRTLNVTGLFQYFFLFVAMLTALVWKYQSPQNKMEARFHRLAIVSGVLGVAILIDLRFNSVIASRLADLLLLPLLISLGIMLNRLYESQKALCLCIAAMLVGYCLMRGYVTFSPRAKAPLPTISFIDQSFAKWG